MSTAALGRFLVWEPKSSNGTLSQYCRNCHQRLECHASVWVPNCGTQRVCSEDAIQTSDEKRKLDNMFRENLHKQEIENCKPTRTVANMERSDPLFIPSYETPIRTVTRQLAPLPTPFGTDFCKE